MAQPNYQYEKRQKDLAKKKKKEEKQQRKLLKNAPSSTANPLAETGEQNETPAQSGDDV
ncbi:MAG: hypothetical protein H0X43_04910 [Nitrosospira sp.]|nr:hypothetical protein [Nitrosospira sp.]